MKIIALNGPPRSGKDTAACAMQAYIFARNTCDPEPFLPLPTIASIAFPIRRAVCAIAGINTTTDYEERKDEPLPQIGFRTVRELMISISENWIKLHLEETFWINRLFHFYAPNEKTTLILTDMGFQYEVDRCLELVGPDNFHLVRVYRSEHTFDNDSRSYLSNPNNHLYTLTNDADINQLRNNAIRTVVKIAGED